MWRKLKAVLYSNKGTRSVSKGVLDGAEKAPWGIGAIVSAIRGSFKNLQEQGQLDQQRAQLLDTLFGTSFPVYVTGSNDHKDFPLLAGELVYPSDKYAIEAFQRTLFHDIDFKVQSNYILTESRGSYICMGASAANPIQRDLLGTPENPKNRIDLEYEAELHFAYIAPDSRSIAKNFQEGRNGPWEERNWGIGTPSGELFPRIGRDGFLQDDYLLVTRLPSRIRGAGHILLLGGTHGVGTQAVELIPETLELGDLKRMTDVTLESGYYQALLHITDISHEGHSSGRSIHLIDVRPISVKWQTK